MNTEKVSQTTLNSKNFEELLELVERPGQYLGNEWGAINKDFDSARARMLLAFPDIYELGMSNFGLKILYQIVNQIDGFMVDRTYAPASDMEALMKEENIPLWAWESKKEVKAFDLVGFSLQYELTYTNVLNMLQLSNLEVFSSDRKDLFPLIFGGGPSSVNPEPMADFLDFFMIGDGEESVPKAMTIIESVKNELSDDDFENVFVKRRLLYRLQTQVAGIYVPCMYEVKEGESKPTPLSGEKLVQYLGLNEKSLANHCSEAWLKFDSSSKQLVNIPERVLRQVSPLNEKNQPTKSLVPYLSLVHDREVLEVRRGCDRGCRFCQPGYTFLPVRERSADDILSLSKEALSNSGHEEYSLLSLCVSDYTSLTDSVRALNREHSNRRTSLSFPSQRADRMNLDIAEELKEVRKSGITLAPEAGTERMRKVVNKGLNHQQIISAIESAYKSGWNSVKLYFMCCLPTERDEDLVGIIEILNEATQICRAIRKENPEEHNRQMEFTCTISNFVPKPFTPFQWFGQVTREETRRKHKVLKQAIRDFRLNNVTLNVTSPETSLLEAVISRGDRSYSKLIHSAWLKGATFDAWDDRFNPSIWHDVAENEMDTTLEKMACTDREVGSTQPWEVIHIGLQNWWLVKEWEKAVSEDETANCTDNTCHACGVCTELDTTHELANPSEEVMKKNPFVKELAGHDDEDSHPSLFFQKKEEAPPTETLQRLRFKFTKSGLLRFIGHLDLQTLLIRAFRRAGIKIAYSQGFNPSPKLSLAAPLPLFMESDGEVAELSLACVMDKDDFRAKVNNQLPEEVKLTEVIELVEKPKNSLSSVLTSASYRFVFSGFFKEEEGRNESKNDEGALEAPLQKESKLNPEQVIEHVRNKIAQIEAQEEILVRVKKKRRKGKRGRRNGPSFTDKNIKPGIHRLEVVNENPLTLEMELACSSDIYVKPQEVLECINPSINWRVTRLELKSENGITLLNHDDCSNDKSLGDQSSQDSVLEKEILKAK